MLGYAPDIPSSTVTTDEFGGLDFRHKISDSSFASMTNMTSDHMPMLASRSKRRYITKADGSEMLTDPQGLLAKDALCWIDSGTLYVNGAATALTGLAPGDKQMVSMGAYVCVFPDAVYYNTADPDDYGTMGATFVSTADTDALYVVACDLEGNEYESPIVSDTAPTSPANGDVWIDTSTANHALKVWTSYTEEWTVVSTVYSKVRFTADSGARANLVTEAFSDLDGVTISGFEGEEGSQTAALNGEKILYKVGSETSGNGIETPYVIIVGLLDSPHKQSSSITIQRTVPQMTYVCEAQNRLWGCFYGWNGHDTLNEIYCCALGDFKNWSRYLGISTDSWRASVGSDGTWTGAVNYLGYPTFFKENRIHRVAPSATGAHAIDETVCRGVQRNCAGSLVVVNETLYYKSPFDFCAYQGSLPVGVSEEFGQRQFSAVTAGAVNNKYYVSALGDDGNPHLLVYDINAHAWHREDGLRVKWFAPVNTELFAVDMEDRLVSMLGGSGDFADGVDEGNITWEATTGIQHWYVTKRMYVARFVMRLILPQNATIRVEIEYDSDGKWVNQGVIKHSGTDSVLFPVRPRRCDHFRIRLSGTGGIKLFSIRKQLMQGSDKP